MKKSDLKQGMLIRTQSNRYGFVELDRNRIDICYDPDVVKDEYAHLEKLSLDDVFEYGDNQLGVGCIVTKELREKYPDCYGEYEEGEICIFYEIVAVYEFNVIYDNGVGVYPSLVLE